MHTSLQLLMKHVCICIYSALQVGWHTEGLTKINTLLSSIYHTYQNYGHSYTVECLFGYYRYLKLRPSVCQPTCKALYSSFQVGCPKIATRIRACAKFSIQNPTKRRACADSRRDFWTTNLKTAVYSSFHAACVYDALTGIALAGYLSIAVNSPKSLSQPLSLWVHSL